MADQDEGVRERREIRSETGAVDSKYLLLGLKTI
jgi:hypothetical protein